MVKILVIDDDAQICALLDKFLRKEGFDVLTAANGEQGLEAAASFVPDLVLCDLEMPGLDGQGVVSALRRDGRLGETPVIFFSGCTERGQIRRSMNLGGDDYIAKPAELPEILEAIRARLSRRRKQREHLDRQLDQAAQLIVGIIHDLNQGKSEVRWLTDTPGDEAEEDNQLLKKVRLALNANQADSPDGETPPISPLTLLVKKENRQQFLKLSEVKVFMACGEYADIFWGKDQHLMFRKPLKQWETELPPEQFVRVHRQAIINLAFLDFVEKDAAGRLQIHLKEFKPPIPVSQRETPAFNRALKKFQSR